MAKKIIIVFVIVLVIVGAIVFGVAWNFSNQLISPQPHTCNNGHFIIVGEHLSWGYPLRMCHLLTMKILHYEDGFSRAKTKTAIIMVHGITADRKEGLRYG